MEMESSHKRLISLHTIESPQGAELEFRVPNFNSTSIDHRVVEEENISPLSVFPAYFPILESYGLDRTSTTVTSSRSQSPGPFADVSGHLPSQLALARVRYSNLFELQGSSTTLASLSSTSTLSVTDDDVEEDLGWPDKVWNPKGLLYPAAEKFDTISLEKGASSSLETRKWKPLPDLPKEETSVYSRVKLVLLTLALSAAAFLAMLDINIVPTAVPSVTQNFSSVSDAGWFGSAYLMATCSFQLLYGRLYTLFPAKWVFLTAITILEIGSVVAGTANSPQAFTAGRAIQGAGTSGIISGAFIIVTQVISPDHRSLIGGAVGSIENFAMLSAPIVGGLLTHTLSWRWCFYINIPIIGFVFVTILFTLSTTPYPSTAPKGWRETLRAIDFFGTVLLLSSITCILLVLEWAGKIYPWNHVYIILLVLNAVILTSTFVYVQWMKGDRGLLPRRVIGKRSIIACACFSLCAGGALVVMTYRLPMWFQAIKSTTPLMSGVMIMPLLAGVALAAILGTFLAPYIGYFFPFMIAGSVFMSTGAGLISTFQESTTTALCIFYLAIFGFGVGIGIPQTIAAARSALKSQDFAVGISVILFAQTLGGSIALSIAQAVFNNRLSANVSSAGVQGLDTSVLFQAGSTSIRGLVAPGDVGKLVYGYNKTITENFYVAVVAASLSVIGALSVKWRTTKVVGRDTK